MGMRPQDKGHREQVTQRKLKARLKTLSLPDDEVKHFCYKAQAKPCSCYLCSPYKYSRKVKHKLMSEY